MMRNVKRIVFREAKSSFVFKHGKKSDEDQQLYEGYIAGY
jgi:hypothetical protein